MKLIAAIPLFALIRCKTKNVNLFPSLIYSDRELDILLVEPAVEKGTNENLSKAHTYTYTYTST